MKKKQTVTVHRRPTKEILSDSYCSNQTYYNDLEKQPSLFSNQVAHVTSMTQARVRRDKTRKRPYSPRFATNANHCSSETTKK